MTKIPFTRSRSMTGTATVFTHFGEIHQGIFHVTNGLCRALVTLPCPAYQVTATVRVTPGDPSIVVPDSKGLAFKAARKTLLHLERRDCGAIVELNSNIQEGIGAGSSTGDVVATIEATAKAAGMPLAPAVVAHLTVDTEDASDPTMHRDGRVRLFAHRTGVDLEVFDGTLPPLHVVGVLDGAPIETLKHERAPYSRSEVIEHDNLRSRLRRAIATQNVAELGAVSTRSAELNQSYLTKPKLDLWLHLSRQHGAVGIAVSHSGSAVSFLFDALDRQHQERITLLKEALLESGTPVQVCFDVGEARLAAAA